MSWKGIVVVLRRLGVGEPRVVPLGFATRMVLAARRLKGLETLHAAALTALRQRKTARGAAARPKESRA